MFKEKEAAKISFRRPHNGHKISHCALLAPKPKKKYKTGGLLKRKFAQTSLIMRYAVREKLRVRSEFKVGCHGLRNILI